MVGCFGFNPQERLKQAFLSDDERYDQTPLDFPAGASKTEVKVVNFRGVADSYEKVLDQKFDDDDRDILDDAQATFSLDGKPDSFTAPMLFTKMRGAGELCRDRFNAEKRGGRKFFNALSNNYNDMPRASFLTALEDVTQRLSRSVCGHDARGHMVTSGGSEDIQQMVRREITSLSGSELPDPVTESDMREVAIIVCTAFLSSSCALTNN